MKKVTTWFLIILILIVLGVVAYFLLGDGQSVGNQLNNVPSPPQLPTG